MKKSNLLLLALSIGFSTAIAQEETVETTAEDVYSNANLSVEVENAYAYYSSLAETGTSNLQLYPIVATDDFLAAHADLEDYMTLEEAMRSDDITISEQVAGGPEKTLIASNNSEDETIFMMAGEIMKGGNQDRVLAQDVILEPGESLDIPVFCVEKDRSYSLDGSSEFGEYYGISTSTVRSAALDGDQNAVWQHVALTINKNDSYSSTKAYTSLANAREYQENLRAYVGKFKDMFVGNENVVGIMAVSGNKVIACDVFANHEMFESAYNNLLLSYSTHAITHGKEVTLEPTDIEDYLVAALGGEEETTDDLMIVAADEEEDVQLHMAFFASKE